MKTEKIVSETERIFTKAFDKVAAKLPDDLFLYSGVGMAATSIVLHCVKQKNLGTTIAKWAAPILLMGLYKKFAKTPEAPE